MNNHLSLFHTLKAGPPDHTHLSQFCILFPSLDEALRLTLLSKQVNVGLHTAVAVYSLNNRDNLKTSETHPCS